MSYNTLLTPIHLRAVVAAVAACLLTVGWANEPSARKSANGALTVTVVFDNYAVDSSLKTGWGYAAIVEFRGHTVLFDTGADGPTLMANIEVLGFEASRIEAVVLSHAHGDHTNGLEALLASGARPKVYVLPSFPAEFKRDVAETVEVIEVDAGQEITDGVFTTGELRGPVNEQGLVVESDMGLVVLTGCAHPGIVEIVTRAKELSGREVHLVMGGFHLGGASADRVSAIIADLRRLGVEKTGPSHCTGDAAIEMFRAEYGDDFVSSGVGARITVEP